MLPVHRQLGRVGKAEHPKQQSSARAGDQVIGASGPGEKSASQRRGQKPLNPPLIMQSVHAGFCGFRIDQGIILTTRAPSLVRRHRCKFIRGRRVVNANNSRTGQEGGRGEVTTSAGRCSRDLASMSALGVLVTMKKVGPSTTPQSAK